MIAVNEGTREEHKMSISPASRPRAYTVMCADPEGWYPTEARGVYISASRAEIAADDVARSGVDTWVEPVYDRRAVKRERKRYARVAMERAARRNMPVPPPVPLVVNDAEIPF